MTTAKEKEAKLLELHQRWVVDAITKIKSTYREDYLKQYDTIEGIFRQKYIQNGAAMHIQKWFRNVPVLRKQRWKKKYAKMIIKFGNQGKFMKAILKTKTYSFKQDDLKNPEKCREAAGFIINRVARGFIGRQKFRKKLAIKQYEHRKLFLASKAIQKIVRRFLVCCRFYNKIGTRYRKYRNKLKKYKEYLNQPNMIMKPAIPRAIYSVKIEELLKNEKASESTRSASPSFSQRLFKPIPNSAEAPNAKETSGRKTSPSQRQQSKEDSERSPSQRKSTDKQQAQDSPPKARIGADEESPSKRKDGSSNSRQGSPSIKSNNKKADSDSPSERSKHVDQDSVSIRQKKGSPERQQGSPSQRTVGTPGKNAEQNSVSLRQKKGSPERQQDSPSQRSATPSKNERQESPSQRSIQVIEKKGLIGDSPTQRKAKKIGGKREESPTNKQGNLSGQESPTQRPASRGGKAQEKDSERKGEKGNEQKSRERNIASPTDTTSEETSFSPKDYDLVSSRPSNLFLNITFRVWARKAKDCEKRLIKFQSKARSFVVRRRYLRQRNARRLKAVHFIENWYLDKRLRYRIRRWYSVWVDCWQCYKIYKAKRNAAATFIQTSYRRYKQQLYFQAWLHLKSTCAKKIGRFLRYYFFRRKYFYAPLAHDRYIAELTTFGPLIFQQTEFYWYTHYFWEGAKKTKQVDKQNHELQRLFTMYALNQGLDITKAMKLFKDCKNLTDDFLTINNMEMQINKIKSHLATTNIASASMNEKRLDYSTWLTVIANISIAKFLRIDFPKTLWDGYESNQNSVRTNKKKTNAPSTSNGSADTATINEESESFPQILDYRYGSLLGKAAWIARFVFTYFTTIPEYKKIFSVLSSKTSKAVSQSYILGGIRSIQAFWLNRIVLKNLTLSLKEYQKAKKLVIQNAAARKLQGMIRNHLTKRWMVKIAQELYEKYVDGNSELPYWYNPRTKQSFWTKPTLLGQYDVSNATRMPNDLEKYEVLCATCTSVYATCYCIQCSSPYCTPCYIKLHQTGNRKMHKTLIIDNCAMCDIQIALKICRVCKDYFCDSCYVYIHKKGRLRFHNCQNFIPKCMICNLRSGIYKQTTFLPIFQSYQDATPVSYEPQANLYCGYCYKSTFHMTPAEKMASQDGITSAAEVLKHRGRQRINYDMPILEKVIFYGRNVEDFKKEQERLQREADIKAAYKKRQEELFELKKIACALTIQRVYRGYVEREKIKRFIEERKQFLALRREEDKVRNSLWTKFLSFIGAPIVLQTDTPLERVKKLYPWYMHRILAECIENQWTIACHMLVEHEEYLKEYPKVSWLEKYSRKSHLNSLTKKYDKQRDLCNAQSAKVKAITLKLQQAQATGAYDAAKLKVMKKTIQDAEKEYKRLNKEREKLAQEVIIARDRVKQCEGPRRLQKTVEDRRKNGIVLPFRVSIRQYSRYALVEYINPEEEQPLPEPAIDEEIYYDEYGYPITVPSATEQQKPPEASMQSLSSLGSAASSQIGVDLRFPKPILEDHSPGAWKKKLRVNEEIFIQGFKYRVAANLMTNAKKKKKKKGQEEDDEDGIPKVNSRSSKSGKSEASEGESSQLSDFELERQARKKRRDKKKEGDSSGGDNSSGVSASGGSSSKKSKKSGSLSNSGGDSSQADNSSPYDLNGELKEVITENHIPLDRPWLYDDAFGVEIYKRIPPMFYQRPIEYLQQKFIQTYPIQKLTNILAINAHFWSNFAAARLKYYDEESGRYAYFTRQSVQALKNKHYWLSFSLRVVTMSYDFTLRKNLGALVYRIGKQLYGIYRAIRSIYKTVFNAKKETAFEFWSRSLSKETVRVYIEGKTGAPVVSNDNFDEEENGVLLGVFKMDTKAPVDILREYVHRNFRIELNDVHKVGESFLFIKHDHDTRKVHPLEREDEFRTVSNDYMVEETDKKTFESFLRVTIMKDKNRGKVLIAEFVEEKDSDDGEGDDDDEDGEKKKKKKQKDGDEDLDVDNLIKQR